MNPQRYKLLMGYLPSVASIVNSFQSHDVQRAVYDSLMEALNVRLDAEIDGTGSIGSTRKVAASASSKSTARPSVGAVLINQADELEQEITEGDSIHSLSVNDSTLP